MFSFMHYKKIDDHQQSPLKHHEIKYLMSHISQLNLYFIKHIIFGCSFEGILAKCFILS
jgi:hypothetical protein